MKKICISVAVMLSAATMSANAMNPAYGFNNETTFTQYNPADDPDGKEGQEIVDLDDDTCDWTAKGRFYQFALQRYILDHKNDMPTYYIEALELFQTELKKAMDINDTDTIKLVCSTLHAFFGDVVANAKAELKLGR